MFDVSDAEKFCGEAVETCSILNFSCYNDNSTTKNTMKHENLEPVHLRIPKKHLEVLQAQADQEFLKLSDIIRRALREWLETQGAKTEQRNG